MAEYKLVGGFLGLNETLYGCGTCGIVVVDRELHTEWHDNNG